MQEFSFFLSHCNVLVKYIKENPCTSMHFALKWLNLKVFFDTYPCLGIYPSIASVTECCSSAPFSFPSSTDFKSALYGNTGTKHTNSSFL